MTAPAFVRSAGERDLPAVASFVRDDDTAVRDLLNAPHSEFVVADDGTEIVGMGFARMIGEGTAQLFHLYVDPVARGVGNGRMLVEELATCFPDARRMLTEITQDGDSSAAFLLKLGFHERDRRNEDGIETLTLSRDLV